MKTEDMIYGLIITILVLLAIGGLLYSSYNEDKFSQECREAGGVPSIQHTNLCLHSSAIIELKDK